MSRTLPANCLSNYLGYRQSLNKSKVAELSAALTVYKGVIPKSGTSFVSRYRDIVKEVRPFFERVVANSQVRVTSLAGNRYSTDLIQRLTPDNINNLVLEYMVNELVNGGQKADFQPVIDAYEVLLGLSCLRTCIRKEVSVHNIGEIFGIPSESSEIFASMISQIPDSEAFHLSYFLGTVLPQPNANLLSEVFEGLAHHEKLVDDYAYRSAPTLEHLNKERFNTHMLVKEGTPL